MAHAKARTNLFARKLMVERVAAGRPAAHVAEQLGVSRATVHSGCADTPRPAMPVWATRAPSVHNTRPAYRPVGDPLELYVDRSRQLRVLDPRERQMMLNVTVLTASDGLVRS